ncbi:MAG TPA: hypothetical protein VIR26_03520 [Metalysinibacillus sp.]
MKFSDREKYLEVYDDLGDIVTKGTVRYVAFELKVGVYDVYNSLKTGKLLKGEYEVCEVGIMRKVYSVYKGDEYLATGTASDLVERLNLTELFFKNVSCRKNNKCKTKSGKDSNRIVVITHDEPHIDYF